MEATGKCGEKLLDFLHKETECVASVCNPFKISSYAKSQLSRTKTDKADAKLIATYVARMSPLPTLPESPIKKQLKEKMRYSQTLKEV